MKARREDNPSGLIKGAVTNAPQWMVLQTDAGFKFKRNSSSHQSPNKPMSPKPSKRTITDKYHNRLLSERLSTRHDLLEDLNDAIASGLRNLSEDDGYSQKVQGVDFGKLEVYRDAFQRFSEAYTLFTPFLMDVKKEYDGIIDILWERCQSEALTRSHCAAIEKQHTNAIRDVEMRCQAEIERLEEEKRRMFNELQSCSMKLEKTEDELKAARSRCERSEFELNDAKQLNATLTSALQRLDDDRKAVAERDSSKADELKKLTFRTNNALKEVDLLRETISNLEMTQQDLVSPDVVAHQNNVIELLREEVLRLETAHKLLIRRYNILKSSVSIAHKEYESTRIRAAKEAAEAAEAAEKQRLKAEEERQAREEKNKIDGSDRRRGFQSSLVSKSASSKDSASKSKAQPASVLKESDDRHKERLKESAMLANTIEQAENSPIVLPEDLQTTTSPLDEIYDRDANDRDEVHSALMELRPPEINYPVNLLQKMAEDGDDPRKVIEVLLDYIDNLTRTIKQLQIELGASVALIGIEGPDEELKAENPPVEEEFSSPWHHFQALGVSDSIPQYLRATGTIQNLSLSKSYVEQFVHELWQERHSDVQDRIRELKEREEEERKIAELAGLPSDSFLPAKGSGNAVTETGIASNGINECSDGTIGGIGGPQTGGPFEDFYMSFLERKFGTRTKAIEVAYNIEECLKKFGNSGELKIFQRVLRGEVLETIWYDWDRTLKYLKDELIKEQKIRTASTVLTAETRRMTSKVFIKALHRLLPTKTESSFEALSRILAMETRSAKDVDILAIFEMKESGNMSQFFNCLLDQHIAESLSFSERIMGSIEEHREKGEATITIGKLRKALVAADVHKPRAELNFYLAVGLSVGAEEMLLMEARCTPVAVIDFTNRLRKNVMLKKSAPPT